jgi:site-specific DNA-methyltransferase (adenine-specific)
MKGDIYLGDCLEDMKLLPDHSVDMILCDLPYGTTQNKWDSIIPVDKLWAEYKRICKGVIVLTATQPFSSLLVNSNIKDFKYEWIWFKSLKTNFLNAKIQPLRQHEVVLVFGNGVYNPQGVVRVDKFTKQGKTETPNYGANDRSAGYYQEIGSYPTSVLQIPSEGKKQHPTQKPVALFEYLIKTYTNEGDTVLDNCAGSGTTGVACVNTNRKYILMEKEPKYVDIIKKRLGVL